MLGLKLKDSPAGYDRTKAAGYIEESDEDGVAEDEKF
jgi:hypothetical protein